MNNNLNNELSPSKKRAIADLERAQAREDVQALAEHRSARHLWLDDSPEVFLTQADVDDLERMIQEKKAKLLLGLDGNQ